MYQGAKLIHHWESKISQAIYLHPLFDSDQVSGLSQDRLQCKIID